MIETRATDPSEFRQAADALCVSYLREPPTDERWADARAGWDNMVSYSSWDAGRCVGHAGYHRVDTNVPGGARLPTAAVTRVGMVPTHTRMGVGTALMEALIADAVEADVVLAGLRASEAVIYRRYGFGVAGDFASATINSTRSKPLVGVDRGHDRGHDRGSVRLLDPDEIETVTAEVDDRCLGRRPGMITRHDPWRRWHFGDASDRKTGAFVAVHIGSGGDGRPDGYVHYHASWDMAFDGGNTGTVKDLTAASDDVELALWDYLFDVDLVESWKAARPVDDLVREALADRRAYRVTGVHDEQWLRLIDVDAALTARSWGPATGSVVIEVSDPLVPGNNGRWRIDADGARRSQDPPDVSVGIDAISALYLGGRSWQTEAAVGRVAVPDSGVNPVALLARCDHLFSRTPAPFCGTFF